MHDISPLPELAWPRQLLQHQTRETVADVPQMNGTLPGQSVFIFITQCYRGKLRPRASLDDALAIHPGRL